MAQDEANPDPHPQAEAGQPADAGTRQPPQTPPSKPGPLISWCRLLRLPNLFTVPGDPMAGFFLALVCVRQSPENLELKLTAAVAISLLMYCAGLLFNDLFDLKEDRSDRPNRPLPSGAVRPASVAVVASVLMLLALGLAWQINTQTLYVSLALAACILIYDGFAKRIPVIGPLIMGACRGLSVLVGASLLGLKAFATSDLLAIHPEDNGENFFTFQKMGADGVVIETQHLILPPVIVLGLIITLYITVVTFIAGKEAKNQKIGLRRFGPFVVIVAATVLYFLFKTANVIYGPETFMLNHAFWKRIIFREPSLVSLIFLWCGLRTFISAVSMGRKFGAENIQKNIGIFIRLLIPLQCAAIAMCDSFFERWTDVYYAEAVYASISCLLILLCLFWPMSYLIGRKFYSS